jgi:hypothetical protein
MEVEGAGVEGEGRRAAQGEREKGDREETSVCGVVYFCSVWMCEIPPAKMKLGGRR